MLVSNTVGEEEERKMGDTDVQNREFQQLRMIKRMKEKEQGAKQNREKTVNEQHR